MAHTKIEWATAVWNPVSGCSKVSPGCEHCYAERMAKRLAGRCGYPNNEPFKVTLHPDRLEEPLRWKKPQRVFVCSMGDLFHEDVPFSFLDEIFSKMVEADWHTYMILTKRPKRMYEYIKSCQIGAYMVGGKFPWANVWLGVTTENQEQAEKRIPILLQIPAAVRFVSVEPMLGPVDLELYLPYHNHPLKDEWHRNGYHVRRLNIGITEGTLDWIICGGETGPGARPMHQDWVRNLRDQCIAAGVPFFFKSWGEWTSEYPHGMNLSNIQETYRHNTHFYRVGKKAAGRLLDGRTWDKYPRVF